MLNIIHSSEQRVLFTSCITSPFVVYIVQSFAYTGFVFFMPAVKESVTSAVLQYAAFQTDTYLKPSNTNR